MNQREATLIEQMTQIGLRLAELTAENKILKSVNDRLLQALPIHSVGGPASASALDGEQLATEAVDTGVWDGERCPRCKSVNLVDVDDHWTKCQDCKFRFVGG